MAQLFDKTFFKFLCGFMGVLIFSLVVFALTELYQNADSSASSASLLSSYE